MKTYSAKESDIKKEWFLVDAKDQILGRLAVKIARILRGKNKAIFTPHVDTGDFVVVVNADKVKFTGKKLTDKVYRHYSGYPGGLKEKNLKTMMERKPTEVIRIAVKGMLPKNKLGRQMLKKLKIYQGDSHPHQAQKAKPFEAPIGL